MEKACVGCGLLRFRAQTSGLGVGVYGFNAQAEQRGPKHCLFVTMETAVPFQVLIRQTKVPQFNLAS